MAMSKNIPISLWDRLQFIEEVTATSKTDSSKNTLKDIKRFDAIGMIFGTIFWSYAISNTFFINIDKLLSSLILPQLGFLIDYKFFVFIIVMAVLMLLMKWSFFLYIYVAVFPLIVLLWKIPRLIYKFKSWILFLSIVDIASSFFYRFKYNFVTFTIIASCFVLILVPELTLVNLFAVVLLSVMMLVSFSYNIYLSFRTSVFFRFQLSLITKFTNSEFTKKTMTIDEKIKNSKAKKLSVEQSKAVLSGVQTALIIHKAIYYWAFQLEKYQKSKMSFLLSGISYFWLFVKILIFLTLINFGVYKIFPNEFTGISFTILDFLNYSLTSLYLNETSRLLGSGYIAVAIRVFSGIVGAVFIGALFINFIFVARQNKKDRELSEVIVNVKREAKDLEEQIKDTYTISHREAFEKIRDLKGGTISLLLWLTNQLPEEYK